MKGTNHIASTRLLTDYPLVRDRYYLVFGSYYGGTLYSYGPSAVVPLGNWFTTNSIAGKGMDDQISILLTQGLDNVNGEIQRDLEDKKHLEDGLKR